MRRRSSRERRSTAARTSWQERFFPGSTFKVVTGSIGVESGLVTPDQPVFPVETAYKPPDGNPIQNFGGESCGGALFDILRVSCNSAFATMGAEVIGEDNMQNGVKRFGFNTRNPIDLPAAATSVFPDTKKSKAFLGQASIGQFDTAASPLEMALVASAVANNGIIMTPHVMKEVRDDNGKVIKTFDPKPWLTAMSSADRGRHAPGDDRRRAVRHRYGRSHLGRRGRRQDRYGAARHRPRPPPTPGSSASPARPASRPSP